MSCCHGLRLYCAGVFFQLTSQSRNFLTNRFESGLLFSHIFNYFCCPLFCFHQILVNFLFSVFSSRKFKTSSAHRLLISLCLLLKELIDKRSLTLCCLLRLLLIDIHILHVAHQRLHRLTKATGRSGFYRAHAANIRDSTRTFYTEHTRTFWNRVLSTATSVDKLSITGQTHGLWTSSTVSGPAGSYETDTACAQQAYQLTYSWLSAGAEGAGRPQPESLAMERRWGHIVTAMARRGTHK